MTTLPIDPCETAPQHIRDIAPYQPGKPIAELARELGIDEARIIKLASNENPLGLSPKARAAIEAALPELARYPDGSGFELKRALAARYQIPPEQIVLGNGSNDLLEMAAIAFLAPGSSAVFAEHAFAVYPLATQARGARGIVAQAKDYGHDPGALRRAVTPETRLVFIANPNNPTGTLLPGEDLEQFLRAVPPHVIVVLDEAYNEYLPEEACYDSVPWLAQHANLIVVRTFSKAYGLAGLRVGFALCSARVADLLNRVRQPFNVNSLALVAAEAALGDQAFVAQTHALNLAGMRQLTEGCERLGVRWIPSYGNFVAVEIPRANGEPQAARVFASLLREGVIVRPVGGYGLPDHLRVSIGLTEENDRFLVTLARVLGKAA
jgi:histidinol-phosphate aminotransferase